MLGREQDPGALIAPTVSPPRRGTTGGRAAAVVADTGGWSGRCARTWRERLRASPRPFVAYREPRATKQLNVDPTAGVIGATAWHVVQGTVPGAWTMSGVGLAALAANAVVLGMLWAHRQGNANMRSVWLCSRNDVIGNCAVLLAALGVFGTGTGWPDVIVAAIMASLALWSAAQVIRQGRAELRSVRMVMPAE
jgi:hypothetical protein